MTGPIIRRAEQCELESWDDPVRGSVTWRTLFSGGRTPTSELTMGIAELPPGLTDPGHPHRHAQSEVYYVLSGSGFVSVDGVATGVTEGSAVFVPGNAPHYARNTGAGSMRLLYVFAVDSFEQVQYEFPGADGSFAPLP